MATTNKYTRTAVTLHWLIALLIAINVVIGLTADSFSQSWIRPLIDFHKSTGILVIGLFLIRLGWRLTHEPPPMPLSYRAWEKRTAHLVHWGLYILIILLPLSGWIHDSAWSGSSTHPMNLYGMVPWFRISFITNLDTESREHIHKTFGLIHTYLSYILYGFVLLHVAGALKHQLINKEKEIQRIM